MPRFPLTQHLRLALTSGQAFLAWRALSDSAKQCCVCVTENQVTAVLTPAWHMGSASDTGSEAWDLGTCLVSGMSCCRLRLGTARDFVALVPLLPVQGALRCNP